MNLDEYVPDFNDVTRENSLAWRSFRTKGGEKIAAEVCEHVNTTRSILYKYGTLSVSNSKCTVTTICGPMHCGIIALLGMLNRAWEFSQETPPGEYLKTWQIQRECHKLIVTYNPDEEQWRYSVVPKENDNVAIKLNQDGLVEVIHLLEWLMEELVPAEAELEAVSEES